jgi:hypothetical protein
MQLDVSSYRRVAERWASKDEDINPSMAAVLMLQMCSEIERLRDQIEKMRAVADVISHAEPKGQGHASGQIPGCLVDHDPYMHKPPEVK